MEYLIHLIIIMAIYGILALSLNLMVGYGGQLSLMQAGFFGIGAYASAILTRTYHYNFFLSLLAGMLISALAGWLIGSSIKRLKGDLFALATFGFTAIIFNIFMNFSEVTKGPMGISGIDRPIIFGHSLINNFSFLDLVLTGAFCTYLVIYFLSNSYFGNVLKAIRDDEQTIRIFGFNTVNYKLFATIICAALASLAGSFYATYVGYIDPYSFSFNESLFILEIIIFGGLASINGALLGTMILILLPEALRIVGLPGEFAAQLKQLIYGLILLGIMFFRPKGLLGEYKI